MCATRICSASPSLWPTSDLLATCGGRNDSTKLGIQPGRWIPSLVESFLPPQVAKRSDVGQSEGEAEQILVAHIGNRVAAILESQSAAIPVVGGLCRGKL